jgi:hypothetical protein
MTSRGDLIVGQAAALVDYALPANGGTVTVSGNGPGYGAAAVTDGSDITYWTSAMPGLGSWIQEDLGTARAINSMRLLQDASWHVTKVAIEYSNDGSAWTALYTDLAVVNDNTITISPVVTARYWRVTATEGASYFCVYTWSIFGGTVAGTAGRMPIGADGTILVADSTQPLGVRWATKASLGIA